MLVPHFLLRYSPFLKNFIEARDSHCFISKPRTYSDSDTDIL